VKKEKTISDVQPGDTVACCSWNQPVGPVLVVRVTKTQIVTRTYKDGPETRWKRTTGQVCRRSDYGFAAPNIEPWTEKMAMEHCIRQMVSQLCNYPWGRLDKKTLEAVCALLPEETEG